MTGFEPQTTGVGSDRSTFWATTTAPETEMFIGEFLQQPSGRLAPATTLVYLSHSLAHIPSQTFIGFCFTKNFADFASILNEQISPSRTLLDLHRWKHMMSLDVTPVRELLGTYNVFDSLA